MEDGSKQSPRLNQLLWKSSHGKAFEILKAVYLVIPSIIFRSHVIVEYFFYKVANSNFLKLGF
jgi:hypothetical protein